MVDDEIDAGFDSYFCEFGGQHEYSHEAGRNRHRPSRTKEEQAYEEGFSSLMVYERVFGTEGDPMEVDCSLNAESASSKNGLSEPDYSFCVGSFGDSESFSLVSLAGDDDTVGSGSSTVWEIIADVVPSDLEVFRHQGTRGGHSVPSTLRGISPPKAPVLGTTSLTTIDINTEIKQQNKLWHTNNLSKLSIKTNDNNDFS